MGRGLPVNRTGSAVVLLCAAGSAFGISGWCGFAALSTRGTGFCAALERDTAKIVAFNVEKEARRRGNAVVAATTHTDLLEDLAPSVHTH